MLFLQCFSTDQTGNIFPLHGVVYGNLIAVHLVFILFMYLTRIKLLAIDGDFEPSVPLPLQIEKNGMMGCYGTLASESAVLLEKREVWSPPQRGWLSLQMLQPLQYWQPVVSLILKLHKVLENISSSPS